MDTENYIDLITWLIHIYKHDGFTDVNPPEELPQPFLLQDNANEHNTDEPQDEEVENQYEGAQYIFTIAHDPSDNTGVCRTNTELTTSLLNGVKPLMLQ